MINTLTNTLVIPQKQLIDYEYDSRERRISKKVWNNTTRSANPTIYRRFLHGSWNLIAEVDGNNSNTLVRSCVWGHDMSGSLQGAGGVGDLLIVKDATLGTHFAAYDLNGNVAGLVSASYGTYTARYEYGPFGELLRATGPMAKLNPFRFSTKYQDDETDLHYYGYRYYNASTGRWLNRDPLDERGGINLYRFVDNNPISLTDAWGETVYRCTRKLGGKPGDPKRTGPDWPGNPLYHEYYCLSTGTGMVCYGQDASGNPILSPGRPSNDGYSSRNCEPVAGPQNQPCFEKCLMDKGKEKRPAYGIGPQGTDCQEWAEDALKECKKKCEPRCPNVFQWMLSPK